MNNYNLENIINKKLNSHLFQDITNNGLQIEGNHNIQKIVTGVSICQQLIDFAIQYQAQAIIVHHGLFWDHESKNIQKIQKTRIHSILKNNINLYSWHIPLDVHKTLGNNMQIAKKLEITVLGKISDIVLWGKFNSHITVKNLFHKITSKFKRIPICFSRSKLYKINTIAWCSGKGQKFIKQAHDLKLDAFLTGEASEDTMHYAHESNINFFAAGHYATERYGIQKLGQWISKKYNLNVIFIDINNPI
ncbi:GTP cyclohydrolase 1 type 2 [Buchnera aphidicola (Phyllaphis fagi)]|uniref:Nif3-like dinuclear metal center hexameric protein n=1 Tax=Buchnera aphidicola TaxID=9 RepID=UPI0034638FA3